MIVGLINQKGGVGKTTLARAAARERIGPGRDPRQRPRPHPGAASPYDVWASADTVALVREAQQFKDKLAVVFVINRKIVNTAIGRDVSAALTQFDIPVSAVSLGQRVIYAESAARGLSVLEVDPHSEAAKEITRLARTLIDGPPLGQLARKVA
jgi:chromosome partitioning protein